MQATIMRPRKSKTQVYIHFVWTTYQRIPVLTPEREREVFRAIHGICERHKCRVIALNGTTDHVHLLVALHSMISYAQLIKEVKAGSSHLVSHEVSPGEWFAWQSHYGAFSVSLSHLKDLIAYIHRQKEHHADGTTEESFEQSDEESEYEIPNP